MKSLPSPKSGGGLPFKQGVINPWRAIGDFELFIFTGGEARMTAGKEEIPCPDGSFLIMLPGLLHLSVCLSPSVLVRWLHFDWTPGRPEASRTLHVDGPLAKLPCMNVEEPPFQLGGVVSGRLQGDAALELHDRVCAKLSSGGPQALRLARALFLEELLALFDAPGPGFGAKPDERLAFEAMKLLREIACRPHREDKSLQAAFASLGRSYAHCERCFKRRFGMSPESCLAGLRMERAKEMLLETSMNIAEVADALGYDDPGYFSRQFSKRAGLSPSLFRSGSRRP